MVKPTGPAPTISVSRLSTDDVGAADAPMCRQTGIDVPVSPCISVLQLCPNLPVAFHRPDSWPIDSVEFVPQTLHVERQAVLEDRPMAEFWRQSQMSVLKGLLQRTSTTMHGPYFVDHHLKEVAGLLDRSVACRLS